ncbi:hypothetical protein [Sediminicola luteus]|nr:hypothetical protein [Sediminicola luteus]
MGEYGIYILLGVFAIIFFFNLKQHKKRNKARKSRRFMDEHRKE